MYIYIYIIRRVQFCSKRVWNPLGESESVFGGRGVYLVCKRVYHPIIRAKTSCNFKKSFYWNARNFPSNGKGPLDADFHSSFHPISSSPPDSSDPYRNLFPFSLGVCHVPRGGIQLNAIECIRFVRNCYSEKKEKEEIWRSFSNATRWRHLLADKIQ